MYDNHVSSVFRLELLTIVGYFNILVVALSIVIFYQLFINSPKKDNFNGYCVKRYKKLMVSEEFVIDVMAHSRGHLVYYKYRYSRNIM